MARKRKTLRRSSKSNRKHIIPRKPSGFRVKRRRRKISEFRLQRGLVILRETKDIAKASRAAKATPQRFKREALKRKVIKKRGKIWIVSRDLRRQMLIYSDGRQFTVTLPSQRSARNVGKYMSAVGAFVRSNNIRLLDDFIDRGVADVAGKRHVFETNPNTLYRLTSSRDEAFEDVYRIVVS